MRLASLLPLAALPMISRTMHAEEVRAVSAPLRNQVENSNHRAPGQTVEIRRGAGSMFLTIKRGSAKANLNLNDFEPGKIPPFEDRP